MRWRSTPQAYQRCPFEPVPAERTSHRRLSLASSLTACAQVNRVPTANPTMNVEATRNTYACPCCSKNSRNWVQLPYTSSPQAKSNTKPSVYASAQMSIASCPLVRNSSYL